MTLREDHPRSRGVYPLTAGYSESYGGIIPARAGFTYPLFGAGRARPDHPRSRGVYLEQSPKPD